MDQLLAVCHSLIFRIKQWPIYECLVRVETTSSMTEVGMLVLGLFHCIPVGQRLKS